MCVFSDEVLQSAFVCAVVYCVFICCISQATRAHEHAHYQAQVNHARTEHTRTHTHTHTYEYTIYVAFPRQQWFANAPQCYVIRTMFVVLTNRTFNWVYPRAPPPEVKTVSYKKNSYLLLNRKVHHRINKQTRFLFLLYCLPFNEREVSKFIYLYSLRL